MGSSRFFESFVKALSELQRPLGQYSCSNQSSLTYVLQNISYFNTDGDVVLPIHKIPLIFGDLQILKSYVINELVGF